VLWHVESGGEFFLSQFGNSFPLGIESETWEVLLRHFTTTAKTLSNILFYYQHGVYAFVVYSSSISTCCLKYSPDD
jgi:hypothetical protein